MARHQIETEFEHRIIKHIVASSHGDGSWKELYLEIRARQSTPTVRWAVDDHGKQVYSGLRFEDAAEIYNELE